MNGLEEEVKREKESLRGRAPSLRSPIAEAVIQAYADGYTAGSLRQPSDAENGSSGCSGTASGNRPKIIPPRKEETMSKETLKPPLPPIDGRTEAVAERLFGLKWALRKDSTEIIHEEWQTASEWIRDGYLRQAIEVLATADQAQPASAKASGYKDRMRVEYRELTARAGRLRGMLQRYADGTLDFEPTCPITLLSRQLDVMDEYAGLLRHRAKLEHVDLEEQDSATE